MGLLQRAIETFDANQGLIGEYREGHNPLAPIGHILTNASIEITINKDGKFLTATRVDKKEPKILIPVTEASGGRSGTKAYTNPHPLCDSLKYLSAAPNYYLLQLSDWERSEYAHPFLKAIRLYLEKNTIQDDLINSIGEVSDNDFVCWRIEGIDSENSACWRNKNLHRLYTEYYLNKIADRDLSLCMITGENGPAAEQHPKGIVAINGNAKLISANDSSGFTYRGRISEAWQAASVSYVASQKAHNALRWLATEQGVREFVGNRIYLCWNPQGKKLPQPTRGLRSSESEARFIPSDYQKELEEILFSLISSENITFDDCAVMTSFDAATTGRLAVVYYNEILADTFLNRIKEWDSKCCWYFGNRGIQAPSLFQIINCAYGIQRSAFLETDDKILRQNLQRLLDCKVNGGIFPADMVQLLCNRASTPQSFSESNWRNVVRTACSVLQKYNYDTKQGGDAMSWELTKKDRSFQFGRLLAAMERAEEDYYMKTQETRQTNAIKFMSEFKQRPYEVFERIDSHLKRAYLPRIDFRQAKRYRRLTGEIIGIISQFPEEDLKKPLDSTYLMGYELQRNAFFTNKDDEDKEEKSNE